MIEVICGGALWAKASGRCQLLTSTQEVFETQRHRGTECLEKWQRGWRDGRVFGEMAERVRREQRGWVSGKERCVNLWVC